MVFKAIFCNPKNKDLLQGLLEKCLKQKLEVIKVETPEIIKKNVYMKNKTLDVLVKTKDNIINIEINSVYYEALNYRNAAYIFEKYAETVKVGEDYLHMPDVIQINFTSGLSKKYPTLGKYLYIDPDTKIKRIDNFMTYEYNIDKIKEMCYNGDKKYDYIAALDFEIGDIEKYCKGDEYM